MPYIKQITFRSLKVKQSVQKSLVCGYRNPTPDVTLAWKSYVSGFGILPLGPTWHQSVHNEQD
jgi:hypothetical protein